MLEENVRIASEVCVGEFDETDRVMIETIKESINEKMKVGCTACNYCMPCPKGVDIPATFRCYNEMFIEDKNAGRREYAQAVGLRKDSAFADACVSCGKCEQHCPQHLEIRKHLKEADKALRPLSYRIGTAIAKWYIMRH